MVIPFLLEPPAQANAGAAGAGASQWENGGAGADVFGGEAGGMSCEVDGLRMQELLCSVGRVVGDSHTVGKEGG